MDSSRLYWLVNSELAKVLPQEPVAALAGVEPVLQCLAAMRSIADSKGAKLTVLAYRYISDKGAMTDAQWSSFILAAEAADITPAILQSGAADLIGFDGLHWNQAGHELVTSVVVELIGQKTE